MLKLNLRTASKWALFAYVIIFMVTTSTVLNRIGQIIMILFCGANWVLVNHCRIKKNNQLISMFLYGGMLVLSSFYSPTPEIRVRTTLMAYAVMLVIIFFVCDNINNEKDINFYLHAILLGSVVQFAYMVRAYGLNVFEVIQQSEMELRVGDDTSNANAVGLTLAYGSVISMFFFGKAQKKVLKICYIIVALLTAVVTFLTGSRKALVVLIIGYFVVLAFLNSNKNILHKLKGLIIAVVVVGIVFYAISNIPAFAMVNRRITQLIEGVMGTGTLDHSSEARFDFIERGWQAFLESPIIGKGTYASYMYFRTYSHNNFIEIFMNTGIVGFLLFYYPYVVNLFRFMRTDKKNPLFGIMLFFYAWILFGGYGFVTYYDKLSMMIAVIPSLYLYENRTNIVKGENENEH